MWVKYFCCNLHKAKNITASKWVSDDWWMMKGLIALMFIQRWDQKICWKGYLCHKVRLWLSFSYFRHFKLVSKVTMYITYFTTHFDKGQLRSISLYNIRFAVLSIANMMIGLHMKLLLVLQFIRNKVQIGNKSINCRDVLAIYFLPGNHCKVL